MINALKLHSDVSTATIEALGFYHHKNNNYYFLAKEDKGIGFSIHIDFVTKDIDFFVDADLPLPKVERFSTPDGEYWTDYYDADKVNELLNIQLVFDIPQVLVDMLAKHQVVLVKANG